MKKIYALLFVVVMVACKDDEPKLSAEQYLAAAANGWIYQSILVNIPGTTTQVDLLTNPLFSGQFATCELDESTVFTSDGKYSVANNTKCDPLEDDVLDAGTWALNGDKTTLTMTSSIGDPVILTKFSIDATNLRGDAEFFGMAATMVLKHK